MKMGIVGLPNVGKSTLFNSLTKAGAEMANYPFCTIEPNVGVVSVPDKRLEVLKKIYNSEKIIPAIIEFVDIAGLVKGASKGEGLGNKFLSHIRDVNAIVEVVRCFNDENITHVDGKIDPKSDIEIINLELIYADMDTVEKRIERATKQAKAEKKYLIELEFLQKLYKSLEQGIPARRLEYNEDEEQILKEMSLLSAKKIIYISNVSDSDINGNEYTAIVDEYAKEDDTENIILSVKMEEELSELSEDEEKEMLEALNLKESGLNKVITASYDTLRSYVIFNSRRKRNKSMDYKKRNKSTTGSRKNTYRY